MSDEYTKPQYKYDQHKTMETLLNRKTTVIPNENRSFEWTKNEWILPMLEGIAETLIQKRYHQMGVFIILNINGVYMIFDAQHRITVLQLCLIAIAKVTTTELKSEILELISKKETLGVLNRFTDEEREICVDKRWSRLPKLKSENEHDYNAFGELVNSILPSDQPGPILGCNVKGCKYTSYTQDELTRHTARHTPETRWLCTQGDCQFGSKIKKDLDAHIKSHTEDDCISSHIPSAYAVIEEFIKARFPAENDLRKLCEYTLSQVIFDIMETTSLEEARTAFKNNNNIGKPVSSDIRLRNAIIARLAPEKKNEVVTLFENLQIELDRNTRVSVNHEHILSVIQNIMVKKWSTYEKFRKSSTYDDMFLKTPAETPDAVFNRFKTYIAKSMEIIHCTYNTPLGTICSKLTGGCEIMMLCILPIGLLFGTHVLDKYFKLLSAASIRIDCTKKFSLNYIGYQNKLICILEKALAEEYNDDIVYTKLREFFLDKILTKDAFSAKCRSSRFTQSSTSKAILQLLQELKYSHEMTLNISMVDLEHIQSQNFMNELEDSKLIYMLGNHTLFSAMNSTEQMRGNRSLKDLPFSEKLPHYERSNIKMTRELGKYRTSGFADAQIQERTLDIANQLYEVTNSILSTE